MYVSEHCACIKAEVLSVLGISDYIIWARQWAVVSIFESSKLRQDSRWHRATTSPFQRHPELPCYPANEYTTIIFNIYYNPLIDPLN